MKPETAARMNELARMTAAEREASLLREIFGPNFASVFPPIAPPQVDREADADFEVRR